MRILLPAIFLLLFATALSAQPADETAIKRVLSAQVDAWNAGDISTYMASGYWNSDSLVFIGKSGPKYGYAVTLASYKKSYADTAAMGKLGFEIISLKKLSPEYYFAIGKWALKRSIGDVSGTWTLLFRRIKGQWKIVVDHSS